MAGTYSIMSSWSRVTAAVRMFVCSIAAAVADFARRIVREVVGWVRTAAGRPYLGLADVRPMVGLNARATHHLRAAKRGRPTVRARWRMCASV